MRHSFRPFTVICITILMCALFTVGCSNTGQGGQTNNVPATSTVFPTATPEPPVLDRTTGKEVLYLSSSSLKNGDKAASGTFFSGGPYIFGALCKGNGHLAIQATTIAFQIDCTQTGNMQVEQFGTKDNPPQAQMNQVQVTASGVSTWEISVQIVTG